MYPGSSQPSLTETQLDNYGSITAVKKWNTGATYPPSGAPLYSNTVSYANIGGVSCGSVSTYIVDSPCSITTTDSSGRTVSKTNYTYNSAGHAIQTSKWVIGNTYLTSSVTYNANGTPATSTDVNGAITNFYYNGTGGCNNLLLTSTVLPVNSLTTSQTWNCVGGVLTSTTDANGQTAAYGYANQSGTADPLWRLISTTDPLNNTTRTAYSAGGTLPVTVETSLLFNNGTSTTDILTTYDGLSRPILQQTRQAPNSANFDTVSTGYDVLGRVVSQGMPCVSTASVACSSPTTTTTYDAVNRPLKITDGGNGTTSYAYSSNDTLITVGPAPSGENLKKRQLERDGLGRLTSVCEITSASGSGTCSQVSAATGYWTQYGYDALRNLTGVSQNAQGTAQTRSYSYDGLSRMTSETNPESGTTTYVYDTTGASSCNGGYTSNGDLVRKVDANGTNICYARDQVHRVTDVTTSRPTVDGCKRFRYDNTAGVLGAIPTGVILGLNPP